MRMPHHWFVCLVSLAVLAGATPLHAASKEYWAIRCLTLRGADRMQRVARYADALRGVKGLKRRWVNVVHDREESAIYYGRYERVLDSRTNQQTYKPDPGRELELIRSLFIKNSQVDPQDPRNWPFRFATVAALPDPDSENPKWDIRNTKGVWSLHVAVFYNVDKMQQRRKAAFEYCKLLRRQGHEAYYFHGPDKSSVCIGSFPKEAVVLVQEENELTGIVSARNRVVEPRLLDLQEKFPENLENGHRVYQKTRGIDGKTRKIVNPSFIVEVPRGDKSGA